MINVKSTLAHMHVSHTSVSQGLQDLRGRLARSASECAGASSFIREVIEVNVKFTDNNQARLMAFAVLENLLKNNCEYADAAEVMKAATSRTDKLMADPANFYWFAKPEVVAGAETEQVAVVDGLDTKVTVKADGSIKKGGKQILAYQMYLKHVIESPTPISNSQFKELLISDLGMTKAGASTYAYNAAKMHKSAQSTA